MLLERGNEFLEHGTAFLGKQGKIHQVAPDYPGLGGVDANGHEGTGIRQVRFSKGSVWNIVYAKSLLEDTESRFVWSK
jgi:hypothetical protein